MIPLDQFLQHVKAGTIPPGPPVGSSPGGRDWQWLDLDSNLGFLDARRQANLHGMWAIVDQVWTEQLAAWLGRRKLRVLEIMAGAGWLAKALAERGITITATDSQEWDEQHSLMRRVYPVEKLDALAAIARYGDSHDALLCSWPPYGSDVIVAACRLWGRDRPIIYIGEDEGGCNAPDEFFHYHRPIGDMPEISLMAWNGIHDRLSIGYWTERRQ